MVLKLFQGFGLELEYSLVDRETLAILPLVDQVLEKIVGRPSNDAELAGMGLSNEFVLHQLEIKNDPPEATLGGLPQSFHDCIVSLHDILSEWGATLLPTGMHPFMSPQQEVRLWPGEYREIYQCYHRLFSSGTHGFGNVQSVHLNLPFADEKEFIKLHAAIRLVLPLLPALAASSPIVEGKVSGMLDTRLYYYGINQQRVPEISGQVIPESAKSIQEYQELILQPMYEKIAPLDPEGLLQEEWLNSRGAIARFDRDAIEIRLLDIQENPRMDTALCALVSAVIKHWVEEGGLALKEQLNFPQENLVALYQACLHQGEATLVQDPQVLRLWGETGEKSIPAGELWARAAEKLALAGPWRQDLQNIFSNGTLSTRILRALEGDASKAKILATYQDLTRCLLEQRPFLP